MPDKATEKHKKEMALERSRKGKAASKSIPPGVGMGKGLQILLESVKWNLGGREGPGPRDKGYKGSPDIGDSLKRLMGFPEIDLDNLPKGKIDAQKGAEMATDMLHTTPTGAIAGMIKKVAPRVINSIYPLMPGRALKDTKYVQRNVRNPKELEHILETGYMLPKEGGKAQKYFTAVDEVNPVTPKGNTMLRISREKVLPDEAVRAEDIEVFDFAKGLWKPLRETAPTVQTGRHTQSEGVSDEVVNWLQSRKEQGITRWVVRKDGSVTPLTGVNSRDYRVPDDAVLVDVQKGKPQILDTGSGVPKAHVEGILARAAKNFKE